MKSKKMRRFSFPIRKPSTISPGTGIWRCMALTAAASIARNNSMSSIMESQNRMDYRRNWKKSRLQLNLWRILAATPKRRVFSTFHLMLWMQLLLWWSGKTWTWPAKYSEESSTCQKSRVSRFFPATQQNDLTTILIKILLIWPFFNILIDIGLLIIIIKCYQRWILR